MKIEKIINDLMEEYYNIGYVIKEICLPKEFKDKLYRGVKRKYKRGVRKAKKIIKSVDLLENDIGIVKLFENPSKHLNIIIRPIRMTATEIKDRAKRFKK